MSRAFTPARRMDVGGVGVHPEVVAVGVAIEMEPQPVPTNLDDSSDGDDDVKRHASHSRYPVVQNISKVSDLKHLFLDCFKALF